MSILLQMAGETCKRCSRDGCWVYDGFRVSANPLAIHLIAEYLAGVQVEPVSNSTLSVPFRVPGYV